MTASEHYQAGQLKEAVEAAVMDVKKNPLDPSRRGILAEMLLFSGDVDRADLQLDAMSSQDPKIGVGIALFRQLIRAEKSRQEFFGAGRVPEFLDLPSDVLKLHLEASIRVREGKAAEAVPLLLEAEEKRVKTAGTADGQAIADFRDLDDLTAPFFEVLTSTGKYYWIPFEKVDLVEFRPPTRPRDLFWVRAHMIVRGGPDGEVYLPALYAGTHAEADDKTRLGRYTDWRGGQGTPVRGVGLRTYLAGEEAKTILELKELTFGAV